MDSDILFEELSADAEKFLHELEDPDLVRNRKLPPSVTVELRREQVKRLERIIRQLRAKQEEFNQKIEDYVANLRRLAASLERRVHRDLQDTTVRRNSSEKGTLVSCLSCSSEKTFERIAVLFARESDESLHRPTQCYVSDTGRIKKGIFRCTRCGSGSLTIRSR